MKLTRLVLPFLLLTASLLGFALPSEALNLSVNTTTAGYGGVRDTCAGFSDVCTLDTAIKLSNQSPESDTISFNESVFATRQTIIYGWQMDIRGKDITINGPNAGLVLTGDKHNRVFSLKDGSSLNIRLLSFRDGYAGAGSGGAIEVLEGAKLNLESCAFYENSADFDGGAIAAYGSGTSTGISVKNSTFSGNRAGRFGGSVFSEAASEIDSCTFTANTAQNGGGITYNNRRGATTQLRNNIVVGNSGTDVQFIDGSSSSGGLTIVSKGYNLIGQTNSSSFVCSGDRTQVTAGQIALTPLQHNGGPTLTHAPRTGSLAIDNGNTDLSVDALGTARPKGNGDDVGAVESAPDPTGATASVVTTALDLALPDGAISLREAMANVNGNGTITFSETTFSLLSPRQTIALSSSLPEVSGSVAIIGPKRGVIISGEDKFRLWKVTSSGNLTLQGLTLSGGNAGTVGSDSVSGRGGAIFNQGALTLKGCTLSGNKAPRGGAIYQAGDLTTRSISLQNVTLSGNEAQEEGGAVYVFSGRVGIESSTITSNTAPLGSAVRCWAGDGTAQVEVHNSILAGNSTAAGSGGDVHLGGGNGRAANFISSGYNLVGGGNAMNAFNAIGDAYNITTVPLNPLADNGGPVFTHRPTTENNRIIDTGKSNLSQDARGIGRPRDSAGIPNIADGSDIGAVEIDGVPQSGTNIIVNTIDDHTDADGCTVNDCSLREAIDLANSNDDANTITFASNVRGTMMLKDIGDQGYGNSAFLIRGGLTIQGPGANLLTLRPSVPGAFRIFRIFVRSAITNISGLTISDGGSVSGGGAILARVEGLNSGQFVLSDCVFNNNSATEGGAVRLNRNGGYIGGTILRCTFSNNKGSIGGVINSRGHDFLAMRECTFQGNSASVGGVLYNYNEIPYNWNGIELTNCTLVNNKATSTGGAICNTFGRVDLTSCTITGNTAPEGGGIASRGVPKNYDNEQALTNIKNCIIVGNSSDVDMFSQYQRQVESLGFNLVGNGNSVSSINKTGDRTGLAEADLKLGPLQNNGGPTLTRLPAFNSLALDAGEATGTDQRGITRPQGTRADVGAVEIGEAPQAGPDFVVTTVRDGADNGCTVLDCTLREAINGANAYNASHNNSGASIRFTPYLSGTITLNSALPSLTGNVTIAGSGADKVTVKGTTSARIFTVGSGIKVAISHMALSGGAASGTTGTLGAGGAILVNSGATLIVDTLVIDGATATRGGAIASLGNLTVSKSSFSNNTATTGNGGAIHSAAGSTISVDNSTFVFNRAAGFGGAFRIENSEARLNSLTITANTADSDNSGGESGAVSVAEGQIISLVNSIVAGNTGSDLNGMIGEVETCIVNTTATLAGLETDVDLKPVFKNNGGSTPTVALIAGRAAVDKGSTGLTTDQRGVGRPQGAAKDVGAFEGSVAGINHAPVAVADTYRIDRKQSLEANVVDNDTDPDGDAVTATLVSRPSHDPSFSFYESGNFFYRAVESFVGTDTFTYKVTDSKLNSEVVTVSITINPPSQPKDIPSLIVNTSSNEVDSYDGLNSFEEALSYANTLSGPKAITFDPVAFSSPKTIKVKDSFGTNGDLTIVGSIAGVTFLRDQTGDNGFTALSGTLKLVNLTLSSFGFAVTVPANTTVVTRGCTFDSNAAVALVRGTLELQHSTATSSENAFWLMSSQANLVLKNSTVTGSGTVFYGNCFVTVANSIVAGNTSNAPPTTFIDNGFNIIGGTAAAAGLDPKGLQDNGGPTKTIALIPGSPAINAGDPAFNGSNEFDQRGTGFPRVHNGRLDIGAFERSLPSLNLGAATVVEGNTGTGTVESGTNFLRLPLSLSVPSLFDVVVSYRTSDGTAEAGSDFIGTSSGSITIPAGQTSGAIVVPILGDKRYEASETFTVTLTAVTNAMLGASVTATGTITNDDQKPTLSINSVSQSEGNSGTSPMIFTVSLSVPSDTETVIPFSTLDGSATAGSDYVAVTAGSVTIPANQSSVPLSIAINGDTLVEGDESFSVVLGEPTSGNATLSPEKSGVGTILNDESAATAATLAPSSVTLFKSGFMRNRRTNRLVQTVVIQNNSGAAIPGPIYLTVDNLVGGTFYGSTGSTALTSPVGSPYRTIVLAGNILPTGATLLDLEFVTTNTGVTYGTRLLVGPGTP